jgi:hypothetical protein
MWFRGWPDPPFDRSAQRAELLEGARHIRTSGNRGVAGTARSGRRGTMEAGVWNTPRAVRGRMVADSTQDRLVQVRDRPARKAGWLTRSRQHRRHYGKRTGHLDAMMIASLLQLSTSDPIKAPRSESLPGVLRGTSFSRRRLQGFQSLSHDATELLPTSCRRDSVPVCRD